MASDAKWGCMAIWVACLSRTPQQSIHMETAQLILQTAAAKER